MFPKLIHDDMADCHSFMLSHKEFNATTPVVAKEEETFLLLRRLAEQKKCAGGSRTHFYSRQGISPLQQKTYSVPSTLTYVKAM